MIFSNIMYHLRTRMLVSDRNSCQGMILMLHRIIEDVCEYRHPQISRLHVTAHHLEKILTQVVAAGYEIISLDDLSFRLSDGMGKSKFAVFTFDDAYRDTYDHALPVFRKLGVPFAVYVPTSVPDQQMFWWYYMLDDLVFNNEGIDVPIDGKLHRFTLKSIQQKCHAYNVLERHINGIDVSCRRETLSAIFEPYGLDSLFFARKLSMTWDHIRELDRSGLVTIGAHTVNHYELPLLSSEEARYEMEYGRLRIEEQIGRRVDHFCYPFGIAGDRELSLSKKLGFKTCVTCQHGYLTKGHRSYLQRLPRIMIEQGTGIDKLKG